MNTVLTLLLAFAFAAAPALVQGQSLGDQTKGAAQSATSATENAAKDVGSATTSGTEAASDKVTRKVDINSASKEDLMKIHGIDDATSDKIIAGRPYKSRRDLLSRNIVDQATYNKIHTRIIAHAPKSGTPAATDATK